MNGASTETADLSQVLELLREGGQLLREGTRIEREKRWKSLDGGIQDALAGSLSATMEGRRAAEEYLEQTRESIRLARDSMRQVAQARGQAGHGKDTNALLDQVEELIAGMEEQLRTTEGILERKSDGQPSYNITLFGRTGTGKSTLMEILTNGEGKTIGKGAQRTTRDVRSYEWKGLKITDVPGVAAFGGEEDADAAHEAAKEADLIVFLVTDDAPQEAEARHLARLRQTGRPIIGVCNVKRNLRGESGTRLFIRNSDNLFDPARLEEIGKQFEEITGGHNPERELPLICTHLLSRFQANRVPEKVMAEDLREASRFWEVEDEIAAEIAERGTYLRIRSYTDMATEAALDASEVMLRSASLMAQVHGSLESRTGELRGWRESFRKRADRKLKELLERTTGKLRAEMLSFAETHWRDGKGILNRWNDRVKEMGADRELCQDLEELHNEMRAQLREIESDMNAELGLLTRINTTYPGTKIGSANLRRWTKWASNAIMTVTGIAAAAMAFTSAAPFALALGLGGGIISAAVRFISNRFKSEDDRRREVVSKFCEQAEPQVNDIETKIRQAFHRTFNEEIDKKGVEAAISRMEALDHHTMSSAEITRQLGTSQQNVLTQLNRTTAARALDHAGHQEEIPLIEKAARVPGQAMTLLTSRKGNLSEEAVRKMESLLGEKVASVRKGTTDATIIRTATGTRNVKMDDETKTASAGYDSTDATVAVEVRLASQLTGLYVRNTAKEQS